MKRINNKGDHSEYDQPNDIFGFINKPGIAKTHNPLKIFEPIKVPVTVSYLPFKANETDAAISGKLVPIANTVYPINNSPKLNSSNIWLAPKVINHAAKTRKTKDRVSFKDTYLGKFISFSFSSETPFLYQEKMTSISEVKRINEDKILNGSIAIINQINKLEINKINKFFWIATSCLILNFFRETIRSIEPKTSDRLATFDPITLPITIEPLFSRETKKVVSISGADVPKAITVDPIKKGEKPNSLAAWTE